MIYHVPRTDRNRLLKVFSAQENQINELQYHHSSRQYRVLQLLLVFQIDLRFRAILLLLVICHLTQKLALSYEMAAIRLPDCVYNKATAIGACREVTGMIVGTALVSGVCSRRCAKS